MDEPTSSLGLEETKSLMNLIKNLKDRGMGIIYISHYLEEIFEIGDRVSILKDGEDMGTYNIKEINVEEVVRKMVNRDASMFYTRITNPHWIYPGDSVWLVPPRAMAQAASSIDAPSVIKPRPKAILIRNRGFVDKKVLEESGTLVGSQKEVMMLAQYDEAYVEFDKSREIRQGDEFSVFEVIKDVEPIDGDDDDDEELGKLVEIFGVVRVTQYDKDTGVARVVVDESLKPIERGTLVGPVHRRFEFVAPTVNERELKGRVVAFLDPTVLAATHQIVFVDRGRDHGVKDGNRFFVIEKRDKYRKSREEPDDNKGYPFEVLAEMRVIETRARTSTCLVTAAVRELEIGEQVEMVKGY